MDTTFQLKKNNDRLIFRFYPIKDIQNQTKVTHL